MEEEINNRLILVPCDFSPLAFHAMEHGAYMSKTLNCRLTILHVASRNAEIPAMTKKMHFVAEDCFDNFGVRPEIIVRHGEQPYSVIRDVANELDPVGVVLKTGGGIRTIKILSGTSIPFLVVQGAPKNETIKNIAFPINFLNKLDEKMKRVIHFSDYYPDAVMHIITPSGKGTEKERYVSTTKKLMTKVLNDQNINFNYLTHDKKSNTAEIILELCKDVDIIVTQVQEANFFSGLYQGLREEKLIKNAQMIPVLCFKKDSDFK